MIPLICVGNGYYLYEGIPISDHQFDYDSWEYFDGKLEGMDRILVGISNLLKGKIDIPLFINSYEAMKKEETKTHLNWFTEERLKLVGFSDDEIKK